MSNVRDSIDLIVSWLAKALTCLISMIKNGETERAGLLILDIQAVINQHLLAAKAFIPEKGVEPIPSNFLKKIAWVLKNDAVVNLLLSTVTGINPFEAAKAEAKTVAMKWGFYNEVYGG